MQKDIRKIVGFVLVAAAFTMAFFAMWQLNMLTAPFVDRSAQDAVRFFSDLQGNGYENYRVFPWTINCYFFPDMTAGEAYDYMMIANLAAFPVLSVGVYLIASRVRVNRERSREGYLQKNAKEKEVKNGYG